MIGFVEATPGYPFWQFALASLALIGLLAVALATLEGRISDPDEDES